MNTPPATVTIALLADTTFGIGFDPAGPADVEVAHDATTGLPIVPGSSLRAMLRDAWRTMEPAFSSPAALQAAVRCYGPIGDVDETAILHISDATLPAGLSALVAGRVARKELAAAQILASLTSVRAQTAIDDKTGGPVSGSLRLVRAVVRGLVFSAPLTWLTPPREAEVAVLAASALAVRNAGLGRTRGRGLVDVRLDGDRAGTLAAARQLVAEANAG